MTCLSINAQPLGLRPTAARWCASVSTAINLCFGEPKRMSVDLDYNYIGHLDRARMLEDRPKSLSR